MSEAINSRLMTRTEAKKYLRGVDPYQVCQPLSFGKRLLWDKQELDAALTSMNRRNTDNEEAAQGGDGIEGELERARKRITKSAVSARK